MQRTGESFDARAACLSPIGTLAACDLSLEEHGGVIRIRPLTLAASIGPRRAIIGVPLRCGGCAAALAAGAARPTSFGTLAALLVGGIARRVAGGHENTACSTPSGLVVGMPLGGGIMFAPGGEELALALVGLAVDDGDVGLGYFAALVG